MRRAARRLPGIRFEAPPPALDEVLPRMDIAAFVGFAAAGPVHLPVAVESAAEFEEIFGADAHLAWDPRRGEVVRAQLAPAVRAFFRNGGTRCWAVRVAETPSTNYFPLPGLVRLSSGRLAPAFARSRCAGSWSDGARVASVLEPRPLQVVRFTGGATDASVEAIVNSIDDLVAGDLLRIELGTRYIAFVAVAAVEPIQPSPPSERLQVRASGRAVWFRTTMRALPAGPSPRAVVYTASREPGGQNEEFAGDPVPVLNRFADWTSMAAPGMVSLNLRMPLEAAPQPGALVSVTLGDEQLWVSVRDVGVLGQDAAGTNRLRITGRALWWLEDHPPSTTPRVRRCERLALGFRVRQNDTHEVRLGSLGLAPSHPRYWADLQDDDTRYAASSPAPASAVRELWRERLFPLAGAGPSDAIYLPLDVPLTPDRFLGAARQPLTALERDGLASFKASLFLDPDLITPNTTRVMNEAEHIRYLAASPRRLKGIHAAIGIEEATIVAAPDAPQRGWTRAALESPPRPKRSAPVPRPEWGAFLDCRTRIVKQPRWAARFQRQTSFRFDSGTYTLEWRGQAGQTFVLEEAHTVDWSDATVIYSGPDSRVNVYGRPRGAYYYRVRAIESGGTSNWSRGLVVLVAGAQSWVVIDDGDYSPDTLVAVHRGLLRMSAARGDLFALLNLPEHYKSDDALAHVAVLKDAKGPRITVSAPRPIPPISLPLDAGEARAFSYGALYHPWAFVREKAGEEGLARLVPDGGMAGVLAARALARGAWIAPANEPLRSVLALSPPIDRDALQDLLDGSINAIRQEARGFLPVSANTLSDDPELTAINVRRLLSLLRRLALREGSIYVFEPNDAAFRRTVQRGFENLLMRMYERGAFAGRTSATAFQVTTGEPVNTPRTVDQGRFVVELRVAPSLPMTFLTVRLVQTGDRTLVTEER